MIKTNRWGGDVICSQTELLLWQFVCSLLQSLIQRRGAQTLPETRSQTGIRVGRIIPYKVMTDLRKSVKMHKNKSFSSSQAALNLPSLWASSSPPLFSYWSPQVCCCLLWWFLSVTHTVVFCCVVWVCVTFLCLPPKLLWHTPRLGATVASQSLCVPLCLSPPPSPRRLFHTREGGSGSISSKIVSMLLKWLDWWWTVSQTGSVGVWSCER